MEGICRHRYRRKPWLPVRDLERAAGLPTKTIYTILGVDRGRWQHFRLYGIPLDYADEYAVRLGFHPSDVWGELWWAVCEAQMDRREETVA